MKPGSKFYLWIVVHTNLKDLLINNVDILTLIVGGLKVIPKSPVLSS